MTKVTFDLIERGKSKAGGWTKAQLEILGVDWPPYCGWIKDVVGQSITVQDATRFLAERKL